jgi:hypothetical protein
MNTYTNPLNLLSQKEKEKGAYNHEEFVAKNSTQKQFEEGRRLGRFKHKNPKNKRKPPMTGN